MWLECRLQKCILQIWDNQSLAVKSLLGFSVHTAIPMLITLWAEPEFAGLVIFSFSALCLLFAEVCIFPNYGSQSSVKPYNTLSLWKKRPVWACLCWFLPGTAVFTDRHLFGWMSDKRLEGASQACPVGTTPTAPGGWLFPELVSHRPAKGCLLITWLPVMLPGQPWLLPTQHPRGAARDLPWPASTLCMRLLASWEYLGLQISWSLRK